MKKSFSLLLTLVLTLVIGLNVVSAQAIMPGGPYQSAVSIQNKGNDLANVTVEFINSAGGVQSSSVNINIAVGDVGFIYIPSVSGLSSGFYSVVISSSQPVAAISNFSDTNSGASYGAFDQGSTKWFLPSLYNNYYSYFSDIFVQNVSKNGPTDITLSIYELGSSSPVWQDTKTAVPSYATVQWEQTGNTSLLLNRSYSGVVTTSGGEVVALANIFGSGGTEPQLYSYNGLSTGSRTIYVPGVYNNYYGWNASITVQNISSETANITVRYSTGQENSYSILPKAGRAIVIAVETTTPKGQQFSAVISSDQDIVVVTNMSNPYNRAASYNGIDSTSATSTVLLPNVMKRYYDYSSAVTCQNVDTMATNITYAFSNGKSVVVNNVVPGANAMVYTPSLDGSLVPDKFNGSVTATSSGAKIVCIVNSNIDEGPKRIQSMDQFYSYNGFNK
jgi:hypothetical protein